MLTVALLENGTEVHIREAGSIPEGSRPKYICSECVRPLIARAGRVMSWHFAHRPPSECDAAGTGEGSIHQSAKLELTRVLKGVAAAGGQLEFHARCTRCEQPLQHGGLTLDPGDLVVPERRVDRLRPDVSVWRSDQLVAAIEVYDGHRRSDQTWERLAATAACVVEIRARDIVHGKENKLILVPPHVPAIRLQMGSARHEFCMCRAPIGPASRSCSYVQRVPPDDEPEVRADRFDEGEESEPREGDTSFTGEVVLIDVHATGLFGDGSRRDVRLLALRTLAWGRVVSSSFGELAGGRIETVAGRVADLGERLRKVWNRIRTEWEWSGDLFDVKWVTAASMVRGERPYLIKPGGELRPAPENEWFWLPEAGEWLRGKSVEQLGTDWAWSAAAVDALAREMGVAIVGSRAAGETETTVVPYERVNGLSAEIARRFSTRSPPWSMQSERS